MHYIVFISHNFNWRSIKIGLFEHENYVQLSFEHKMTLQSLSSFDHDDDVIFMFRM